MTDAILTQQQMKRDIVAALEKNDIETILTLARQNRKMFSILVRLAYDKDTLIGWRAIRAVGHVATVFVRNNYEFLREIIRKLLWSLSDESGGIGWSAPEMLGEIVRADPQKMADVVPLIAEIYSIEEKVFRPGVLYALKRIAESRQEAVIPFQKIAVTGLSENDPLARVYSLELLMLLKGQVYKEYQIQLSDKIRDLVSDKTEAWIYADGEFVGVEISDLAKKVYKFFS